MKRDSWPVKVGDDGIRPAGPPDACFYCRVKVGGGEHLADCPIRQKTVVIKVSVEMVREVPEEWDVGFIEDYISECMTCSRNVLADIASLNERLEEDGRCPCGMVTAEYVREATAEDEERNGIFVALDPVKLQPNDKPFECVGGPRDGRIDWDRIAVIPDEMRLPISDRGLNETTLARYVATDKLNDAGHWIYAFAGLVERDAPNPTLQIVG